MVFAACAVPGGPPDDEAARTISYRRLKLEGYYAKLAVFSARFERWDRVLFVDAKSEIRDPMSLRRFFANIDAEGALLTNPDGFPQCVWRLETQFVPGCGPRLLEDIGYPQSLMDNTSYFQETVMLYDTAILSERTTADLSELWHRASDVAFSDQGLLNLLLQAPAALLPRHLHGSIRLLREDPGCCFSGQSSVGELSETRPSFSIVTRNLTSLLY